MSDDRPTSGWCDLDHLRLADRFFGSHRLTTRHRHRERLFPECLARRSDAFEQEVLQEWDGPCAKRLVHESSGPDQSGSALGLLLVGRQASELR